ncbi:hypothetical protein OIO90_002037 [Microbotryomycetes sp. JL221]|nr:hypothetical protein OIO90_002037 [Microbotryomycetes sp. JL221]
MARIKPAIEIKVPAKASQPEKQRASSNKPQTKPQAPTVADRSLPTSSSNVKSKRKSHRSASTYAARVLAAVYKLGKRKSDGCSHAAVKTHLDQRVKHKPDSFNPTNHALVLSTKHELQAANQLTKPKLGTLQLNQQIRKQIKTLKQRADDVEADTDDERAAQQFLEESNTGKSHQRRSSNASTNSNDNNADKKQIPKKAKSAAVSKQHQHQVSDKSKDEDDDVHVQVIVKKSNVKNKSKSKTRPKSQARQDQTSIAGSRNSKKVKSIAAADEENEIDDQEQEQEQEDDAQPSDNDDDDKKRASSKKSTVSRKSNARTEQQNDDRDTSQVSNLASLKRMKKDELIDMVQQLNRDVDNLDQQCVEVCGEIDSLDQDKQFLLQGYDDLYKQCQELTARLSHHEGVQGNALFNHPDQDDVGGAAGDEDKGEEPSAAIQYLIRRRLETFVAQNESSINGGYAQPRQEEEGVPTWDEDADVEGDEFNVEDNNREEETEHESATSSRGHTPDTALLPEMSGDETNRLLTDLSGYETDNDDKGLDIDADQVKHDQETKNRQERDELALEPPLKRRKLEGDPTSAGVFEQSAGQQQQVQLGQHTIDMTDKQASDQGRDDHVDEANVAEMLGQPTQEVQKESS